MRSTNGMMSSRPGSSTRWNLPRRSTTQAFCCGTMRTPSNNNTMIMATRNVATVAVALCVSHAAASVTRIAMIVFTNISVPSLVVGLSARLRRCHDERVAVLRFDVEGGPGRGILVRTSEARVPEGTAVAHPRDARRLVRPALEHDRLAAIEQVGAGDLALRGVPVVHQERAGDRHGRADERLHELVHPEPRRRGRGESAQADHQQIQSPRYQFGNDERK